MYLGSATEEFNKSQKKKYSSSHSSPSDYMGYGGKGRMRYVGSDGYTSPKPADNHTPTLDNDHYYGRNGKMYEGTMGQILDLPASRPPSRASLKKPSRYQTVPRVLQENPRKSQSAPDNNHNNRPRKWRETLSRLNCRKNTQQTSESRGGFSK